MLDEGSLTDSQGRRVNFQNTTIILTSNLGSDILMEPGATNPDGTVTEAAKEAVLERVRETYPPELVRGPSLLPIYFRFSNPPFLPAAQPPGRANSLQRPRPNPDHRDRRPPHQGTPGGPAPVTGPQGRPPRRVWREGLDRQGGVQSALGSKADQPPREQAGAELDILSLLVAR